jgi:methionine-rich copper-binding protein CopC
MGALMPDRSLRKRIIFWVLLTLLFGGLAGLSKPAGAHSEYDRSEPMVGAVIAEAPAEVHVWFTQELFRRAGANTLEVFGPSGAQTDKGDARIDDDDRTHMIVSLPEALPAGTYTVRWQTLSAEDGDTDSGEFTFTVDPEAARTTPPPEPTLAPQPTATAVVEPVSTPTPPPAPTEASSGPGGLPCLGGLILGGLVLGLVLAPRQRSRGVS